jgi:hypothetical protein
MLVCSGSQSLRSVGNAFSHLLSTYKYNTLFHITIIGSYVTLCLWPFAIYDHYDSNILHYSICVRHKFKNVRDIKWTYSTTVART